MPYAVATTAVLEQQGATAVEYAVMLWMILLVVIGAVTTVGTNTNRLCGRIVNSLAPSSSTDKRPE